MKMMPMPRAHGRKPQRDICPCAGKHRHHLRYDVEGLPAETIKSFFDTKQQSPRIFFQVSVFKNFKDQTPHPYYRWIIMNTSMP